MTEAQRDQISELFATMLRMHRAVLHGRMADAGTHVGQPYILFELAKNQPMNQRDLARALHLSPATITITLTRMEKAGLVARESDAHDKRVQNVMITPKGNELMKTSMAAAKKMMDDIFHNVADGDSEVIIRVMTQVCANMDALAGGREDEA